MSAPVENIESVFDKIGGFGRFQLFSLLTIIYPEMPSAVLGMLPVFVGGIPDTWMCSTEENDTITILEMSAEEICFCNGTRYGGENSIVSEWNLVCEYAWVSDFITSIQMAGFFIGGLFGSQVADWIGRKKTLYLSCFLMFTAGAASSVSPSPVYYAIARFIVGVNISAYLVVGVIYPMEFFTPKYRSLSGTLGPWGEGVMLLSLLAYLSPNWRTLSWITVLPMSIVFLTLPFMPESPRWLLRQGKVKEAKQVLEKIAKWNKCSKVDDAIVDALGQDIKVMKEAAHTSSKGGPAFIQLLSNQKFCVKILVFMALWFSGSVIYYGVSFGAKNLSSNIYSTMVYMGLIDAVAFPISCIAISWLGRRVSTIGFGILAAIPLMAIIMMELEIFLPHDATLKVILALTSRFFVDGSWSTCKCFTGESFPTSMRSSALGICTVAAAVGGIIAPQVVFLGTFYPSLPFLIFGGLAAGSACLTFLLQETKGKPIEESEY